MTRAFTLLEVVLALSLTVLLLGASMSFLWHVADRRTTLARGSRDLHAAAVIIERLETDLVSGLAGDGSLGAGVAGTEHTLKLLSRGVWLADVSAAQGDLQASEFSFDPASGRVSARRYIVKPGAAPSTQAMEQVSDRVERLRFRYYNGRQWLDSFDSSKEGALPVAVEVAVWFTALKNAVAPALVPAADASSEAAPTPDDPERRWPAPDRLRVIIVPDGPTTSSQEGA